MLFTPRRIATVDELIITTLYCNSSRSTFGRWRDRLQSLLEARSSASALSLAAPSIHAALTLLALTIRECDHAALRSRLLVWSKSILQIIKVCARCTTILYTAVVALFAAPGCTCSFFVFPRVGVGAHTRKPTN